MSSIINIVINILLNVTYLVRLVYITSKLSYSASLSLVASVIIY